MDGERDLASSAMAAYSAGSAQGHNSGVYEGMLRCPVLRPDELAVTVVVSRNWIDVEFS